MMLEFLETGKALYVLTAVCILGLLCRLTARNLYRRLIRETDNMTLTKNRYLRELRQKAENTYRLNQGIHNTKAYLEKQLTGYRFLGLTLNGWGNLAGQMTILCFLAGGAAAFGSYWYRCDNYYVVLYGTVGLLAGLLTLFVDCGVNLSERRNQLVNGLQDYLENSLFNRLARETASASESGRGIREMNVRDLNVRDLSACDRSTQKEDGDDGVLRDGIRSIAKGGRVKTERSRDGERSGALEEPAADRLGKRSSRLARKAQAAETEQPVAAEHSAERDVPRRDVDYLKHSLEQIAASREKNRGEGDWIKDLSPDELELVGEILKQYLA